ncbi:MAG: aldo/keto reductase [Clostridiales Family XIII bacterium]|jgi:predicted aldo/keto reductase-like oxidoreductase|nr:aldo/keto reductase [Clostridiales Family XIII bacterium]
MNYRINPKTGEKLSLLGFGAMRLPAPEGDPSGIDAEESVRMIRRAVDCGVNYIDTAYTYYEGGSERIVAEALKDGYGDGVSVATKLPVMRLLSADEHEGFLETSLRRLNRDSLEYYLLHGVKERYWPTVKECKTADFLLRKKEEGLIKNVGFSFHGRNFEFFREVLEYAPWDFVQIQLNYMDAGIQAGVKGLKYAASKGLPVFIMEPLKGGKLTERVPPSIQRYWNTLNVKRSAADWGLSWLANFPEVTVILSGMSSMEQLEENVDVLSRPDAGRLSEYELSVISDMAAAYNKLIPYPCTACRYCVGGCPMGIDIPLVISMRNEATIFDCHEKIRDELNHFVRKLPSTCVACGKCEDVCPQRLRVSAILNETAEMFEDESLQWWRAYVNKGGAS